MNRERLRQAREEARAWLRPPWRLALLMGGLWLGVNQLRIQPWHHLTFIWVFGFTVAIYGAYGLYREVTDRVRFSRWLRADPLQAHEEADEMREVCKRLPGMYRRRFQARRAALDESLAKRQQTTR